MDDVTEQLSEKETAFTKAVSTTTGCMTREQLENARAYIRQYISTYGDGPECPSLWSLVKQVDERLFPLSQRPLEEKG